FRCTCHRDQLFARNAAGQVRAEGKSYVAALGRGIVSGFRRPDAVVVAAESQPLTLRFSPAFGHVPSSVPPDGFRFHKVHAPGMMSKWHLLFLLKIVCISRSCDCWLLSLYCF